MLGPAHLCLGLLNVQSPLCRDAPLTNVHAPAKPEPPLVLGMTGLWGSAVGRAPGHKYPLFHLLTLPLTPVRPWHSHFLLLSLTCPYLCNRTRENVLLLGLSWGRSEILATRPGWVGGAFQSQLLTEHVKPLSEAVSIPVFQAQRG